MNLKLHIGKGNESQTYHEAVGSLMYLALCTRPDIAFAVSYVSRFLSCADEAHWAVVKRIFKYLSGTRNAQLVFSGNKDFYIQAHGDADWASDVMDRKSVSGFVIILAGAAVSWYSKKQGCVALSTTEAEFIASSEVVKEVIWIKNLLIGIGVTLQATTNLL